MTRGGCQSTDQEAAGRSATERTPRSLVALRERRSQPHVLLAAALVGLAVAWIHWLGLFAAGAFVGLVSRTFPRAVAAGFAVGVLALVATIFASPAMSAGEFLALAPATYVTVAAALVAPLWGSLIRGVV